MRGGPHLTQRDPAPAERDGPALPPMATGLVLGLWVAVLLVLALFVVPTLFGSCTGAAPA
jgi:hypothetical protein